MGLGFDNKVQVQRLNVAGLITSSPSLYMVRMPTINLPSSNLNLAHWLSPIYFIHCPDQYDFLILPRVRHIRYLLLRVVSPIIQPKHPLEQQDHKLLLHSYHIIMQFSTILLRPTESNLKLPENEAN